MWRRIQAEGVEWEVRAVSLQEATGAASDADARELLEFRALDGLHPPRRVASPRELNTLDDAELRSAFRQALPIGGDHYGRPGKRMSDA